VNYILTGFRQDNNLRHFVFEGIAGDRTRLRFTVDVDLALVRKHQIAVQDLPLLCRRVLEQRPEEGPMRTFTFTETEMLLYANNRAAAKDEAASKKKPFRRTPASATGAAWRGAKI
jgi:hypothetical protein